MPLVSDISGSSAAASKIGITGSVVFAGADPDYAVTFPSVGTDVAFYVSGSIGAASGDQTTTVFGGDTVVSGNLSVGTGSAGIQSLNVYANVSSDFAAKIDNDQSSAGHILKLLTDGNGSGTTLLEMEDGDGDTLFKARADGRFGFGASGVASMGAGTFVVGIDGDHAADIAISKRLQHLGDSDTYVDFPANDQMSVVVGGVSMLEMVEGSNDYMLILSGGGASSPNQADAADSNFFVSGSTGSRGTAARGTAVFGGDVHISGTVTAGGGISGAVSAVANGSDNRVATFSSSDALNGEANLTFDGTDLGVSAKVFHVGDTDTFINFTDDDINIQVGGINMLDFTEGASDSIVFNEGGVDVDFRVESKDNEHMLFINGNTNRLSIGTAGNSPDTTVHMKDETPTLRIQRSDNANNSTIEWAGAAGVRANMFHLGGDNDLIISSWNGTAVEESLRFVPITRQIIFNSGTSAGPAAANEAAGSDISFYVSGAQYAQSTSTRGVAVFGGDVYASGTVLGRQYYMHQGTYQKGSNDPVFLGLYNNNEATSVIDDVTMVAPFSGRCVRIIARSDNSSGLGATIAGFHKVGDGTEFPSTTAVESVANTGDAAHTPLTFDFSLSGSASPPATAFSAGDCLAFSINPANTHGEVNFCIVLEYVMNRVVSGTAV